jgi:hypothetical protein
MGSAKGSLCKAKIEGDCEGKDPQTDKFYSGVQVIINPQSAFSTFNIHHSSPHFGSALKLTSTSPFDQTVERVDSSCLIVRLGK